MGKPTGFLEIKRELPADASPVERTKHWNEFHDHMPEKKLQDQGARCMDCGIPFCHNGSLVAGMASGCPINNLIPEWNDLVYRGLWREALDRLRERGWDVEVYPGPEPPPRDLVAARIDSGIDALVTTLRDRIDADLMARGARAGLKIVAQDAVGVDNLDVAAASAHGIPVSHTPDVLTDATADLTWALILACARRIPEGINLVRSGKWKGWHPELLLGMELRGKTLGLFGAGRIGQAVGARAVPFGLRILYASRSPKLRFEEETGATRAGTGRLLQESDILSLHVPVTPETPDVFRVW